MLELFRYDMERNNPIYKSLQCETHNEGTPCTMYIALHNVYMRDYDSPVYKIALYMLQGNNRISLYIRRILAFYARNLVVATGNI